MDQLGDELKKVLQAGIGAVATGLEKAQGAIDGLAKKGEPIYEEAKSAVIDVVDKAKQAINEKAKPQVEDFIGNLKQFSGDELNKIRAALDDLGKKPADGETPEAEIPEADAEAKEAEAEQPEEAVVESDDTDA